MPRTITGSVGPRAYGAAMRERGPAVQLIWWDEEDGRVRRTYRAPGVHFGGWAWTWELAEQALMRTLAGRAARDWPCSCLPAGWTGLDTCSADGPSEDERGDRARRRRTRACGRAARHRPPPRGRDVDERIQAYFRVGAIRVDGHPVTDLDQPAPPPARLVIAPS
jgi:hypothetical protein